jgi:hypothetical protein
MGEFLVVFAEEGGETLKVSCAYFGAEGGPGWECGFGGCDGGVCVAFACFTYCEAVSMMSERTEKEEMGRTLSDDFVRHGRLEVERLSIGGFYELSM